MSLSALSGFGEGLSASVNRNKDREAQAQQAAQMDRYIDVMQSAPQSMGVSRRDGMTPFVPQQQGPSGVGRPAPQQGYGDDTTIAGLLKTHEGAGDPSTLFGHSQRGGKFDGVDVSKMTIGQLREFSRPDGEYGQWVKSELARSGQRARVATPMGFGQIVGTTMRNTADTMGISDDTVFDEGTQTKMVNYLAQQRLKSARSPAAKRAAMRAEWEGFKHVPDSKLDAAIANFEANGGQLAPRSMGLAPV